ncbi:MAG: TRZ/ATZ family hydrolase [bacterium]
MEVDKLLHARWVIPVSPDDRVLEHHSVAISHGRIVAILPSHEAREQLSANEVHGLDDHALIPGLINAHTHSPMALFRGLADDLPLMTWLNEHIWPAEQKWVHEEFVADGTRLAVAEMIRGGTTCFNDMYFFPDVTAHTASQAGIRAAVGLILIDFPSSWAADPDGYFEKAIQVHDHFRADPLVSTLFAPHAPYSVSDGPLNKLRTLADELDIPIHMHVHETEDEIRMGVEAHDKRPMRRLKDLQLLTPQLVAVHACQLNDEDFELLAQSGSHVVHCPESNQKLASGFCPVQRLLEAGVNVALGTDGAASNNDLDMLGEMRSAALLAKAVANDASALPAFEALKMATLNGAQALGIAADTGSLEIGKAADIAAIDLSAPETQPVFNPISQIVYASGREQVTDVWVAGEQVLRQRQLTTIDLRSVVANARDWQQKISTLEFTA